MTKQEKQQVQYLLARYVDANITEQEHTLLFQLLGENKEAEEWRGIIEELMSAESSDTGYNRQEWQPLIDQIIQNHPKAKPAPVRRMRPWIKWVAAAVLIAGVLTSVIVLTVGVPANKQGTKQTATTNDVSAPNETRAVITLANGTKVYLDSVNTGTIAQQDNVNVTKSSNGEIQYSANSQQLKAKSLAYNTLSNPRGSKVISLTLSDGTKVWLNSESSLRYPASFAGSTREVEITGEAYFEVKHNAKQPFKVHLPNGSVVEDIGTSFNINAYPDEDATKTTLIEGSIRVSSRLSAFVAKPKVGEQVIENPNSPLTTDHSPDLDEVLAWKNGFFQFSGMGIEGVMRQLERWYDIEVKYEGQIPDRQFAGQIDRNATLSQVLKILQESNVHFKLDNRTLVVTP